MRALPPYGGFFIACLVTDSLLHINDMPTTIHSAQVTGLGATPISVEVDITPGLHLFSIVGLADKEVQESRERIGAAIKNLGALPPHGKSQRVIVNLAPADIKKEGPAFDLPIAIGYLAASGQISFDATHTIFLGELGLDGALRRVSGVLPVAIAARDAGFSAIIVPRGNGGEAAIVDGIAVYEAASLGEVVEHCAARRELSRLSPTHPDGFASAPMTAIDFKDIRGQEKAKRALEIAAAGGHNVLMVGPPGAGKTILARALPSILPPPSFEEALEVTKIYSVMGLLGADIPFVAHRPFRSPHHTSSHTAIVGGGSSPRPGEITLAHRGVLFLDEFPEFDRRVLESLRQPLEEGTVTVARTGGSATFPARFILAAAMNPCPCGNFGNPRKPCSCAPGAVLRYTKKISGPMLDRIDLTISVPEVEYDKLEGDGDLSSAELRERILRARDMQRERFVGTAVTVNAEMGLRDIKKLALTPSVKQILRRAHDEYRLSARAYHRLIRTSRTVADLAGSPDIEGTHVLESLQYRPRHEL